MFKNITVYTINPGIPVSSALNELLAPLAYTPAAASQSKSVGFVPPREENGALVESIVPHLILKLMIETRAVPADAVNRKVQEQLKQVEATTGRKPGKKETREIAEDARLALLPMAFSKFSSVLIWIDRVANLLVVGTTSGAQLDEAITFLVKAIDGLEIQHLKTVCSPASSMATWLTDQEAPANFTIDRECELKASDETKAVVRYGKHPLDIEEVRQHIARGKIPTRLAMTFNDRVSFVLTDSLQVKKIAFLEGVFADQAGKDHADSFDADVTIATGELASLISDLVDALGGEVVSEPNKSSD